MRRVRGNVATRLWARRTAGPTTRAILTGPMVAGAIVAGAVLAGSILGISSVASAQEPAKRDWTILVYLAADNNLEPFALRDLDEIEAGLPEGGSSVEVLALIDRTPGYSDADGDWQGARLYRVRPDRQPGVLASEVVQDLGEIDTGDPAVLADAVGRVFKDHPAEHTGVVMWNHGGGWAGMAQDVTVPGKPEGESDSLTLPELAKGLRDGLARAGLPRLDLIGFDMCLMAQLEVATEIAPLARVMVASQAIEPGDGWAYDRFLTALATPATGPRELAARIVDDYHAYYAEQDDRRTTLSAIDLDRIDEVNGALDRLVTALDPAIGTAWADLSRSVFWAAGFAGAGKIRDLDMGKLGLQSVDLADLVERARGNLGDRFTAKAESEGLNVALRNAIIANRVGDGFRRARGLAVYAPVRATSVDPSYAETRFAGTSAWPGFLRKMHDRQNTEGKPVEVRKLELVSGVDGTPMDKLALGEDAVLNVEIAGDNVLLSTFLIGRDDPSLGGTLIDSVGFLIDTATVTQRAQEAVEVAELLAPVYAPGGARLSADLPGVNMLVAGGQVLAQPTLDASSIGADGTPQLVARAIVERPGQGSAEAIIGFDTQRLRGNSITLQIPDAEGRRIAQDLKPEPTDRVTFLAGLAKPGKDSLEWVPAGPPMAWGEGPEIVLNLAPAGRYRMQVGAEAIGGRSESATIEAEVTTPAPAVLREIHAAKSFTAADLVGEWQLEDGTRLFRLSAVQGVPTELDMTLLAQPMAQNFANAGVTRSRVRLDTRRLPTLGIQHSNARGQILLSETNLFFVWPGSRDRVRIRSLFGVSGDARGQLINLVRVGSPAATGQDLAPVPEQPVAATPTPPTPAVAPAAGEVTTPAEPAVVAEVTPAPETPAPAPHQPTQPQSAPPEPAAAEAASEPQPAAPAAAEPTPEPSPPAPAPAPAPVQTVTPTPEPTPQPAPAASAQVAPGLDARLVGGWYGAIPATKSFVFLVLDPTGNLVQTEILQDGKVMQIAGRWTTDGGSLKVEILQVYPAMAVPPRTQTTYTLAPDGSTLQTATVLLKRL